MCFIHFPLKGFIKNIAEIIMALLGIVPDNVCFQVLWRTPFPIERPD